jgi:serine phosphatase RsbU (regulator of sigma subunit)
LSRAEPPRLSAEFIRVVIEFGRELAQVSDGADRLARLVHLPVGPALGAWWCHAMRIGERGRDLTLELIHPPAAGPDGAAREPHLSRTVLHAMLDGGGPVIANSLLRPASFEASMTVTPDVEPVAVIACPIDQVEGAAGSRTSRVLYITLSPQVAGIEWLAMVSLAVEQFRHSESAWAAREADRARASLEREMAWARELQAHTLPRRRPGQESEALDWALRFEPCFAVGGDYADVIYRPDGLVLLVVADVSGKGLRAALVASKLHAIFNADESCRSLVDLVNAANRHLCRSLPRGAFVTLVAVLIDPRTGRGTCVNAGHPPPVTVDDRGRLREIEGGGNFPLGLMDDERLLGAEMTLETGQYLCLYTDGISEMGDPEGRMLGIEGFHELLTRVRQCAADGDPCEVLATTLRGEMDAFRRAATATDDLTLLVVRLRDAGEANT